MSDLEMTAADVQGTLRDSLLQDVAPPAAEPAGAGVDPLLGTQLGNYAIRFVLGKGAYGTVYKAQDVKLDRFVALKFLHEFLDARHEAMFLSEAKAIAALGKHPNIVQIYEWNEFEGRNYFVLEFVGSNAGMLLKVHPRGLPVEQAIRITHDCTKGLGYAHRQGIIHRDVKPANVLLELDGGVAKLADFGVARLFGAEGGGEEVGPGGSPPYMAPEIVKGAAGDALSDVYSLGVTLYELLCGRLPFEGNSARAILDRVARNQGVPLSQRKPDIPASVIQAVERAMAYDPARRPRSAEELGTLLAPLLGVPGAAAHAAPTTDQGTPEQASEAKTRAFKAVQEAKQAGAEKLAHGLLSRGIGRFRDGEAHERLKQYSHAVLSYGEAQALFAAAQKRAADCMAEILAMKAAQTEMMEARREAEEADAPHLVAKAFAVAVQEEQEARAERRIAEATARYQAAKAAYELSVEKARRHGEALLSAPRRGAVMAQEQALHAEAEQYAPDEAAAAERALQDADASRHDLARARAAYAHAQELWHEALRIGLERKQREADMAARPPITVAGIELVWIPPGEFTMGSGSGGLEETPPHPVALEQGFWMGRFPVTQGQWEALMGSCPAGFRGKPELPMESISWFDCQVFLGKLNALGQGTFRFPSEAEWEYACRAGSAGEWCFGSDREQLDEYAWHPGCANGRPQPVGKKRPNAWGLHDMHGNVCEWCADTYYQDYGDAKGDAMPRRGAKDAAKVTRGGSWCVVAPDTRSAARSWYALPESTSDFVGLRVCRDK